MPVDSPTSSVKSIDVKRERLEEEDTEPEQVKNAESEWNKGSKSEWITDMSGETEFISFDAMMVLMHRTYCLLRKH